MPDAANVEMSKFRWIWVAILVLLIDQVSKHYITLNWRYHELKEVLPFLNIYLDYNRGAAFSFLTELPNLAFWLFSSVAVIMSIVLTVWMYRLERQYIWLSVSLAFILGGAIGNLIDRIRFGHVIDFISFHVGTWHFAIFNIADVAISCGAAMLAVEILWRSKPNKNKSEA